MYWNALKMSSEEKTSTSVCITEMSNDEEDEDEDDVRQPVANCGVCDLDVEPSIGCRDEPTTGESRATVQVSKENDSFIAGHRPDDSDLTYRHDRDDAQLRGLQSQDGPSLLSLSSGLERHTAAAAVIDGPWRLATSAADDDDVPKIQEIRTEWNRVEKKRFDLLRSLEQKSLELAEYRESVSRAEEARRQRRTDRVRQKLLERMQQELERQELERQEQEQEQQKRACQKREQQQRVRQERSRQNREQCEREQQDLEQIERALCEDTRGRRPVVDLTDQLSVIEESPSDDDDYYDTEVEEPNWGPANGLSKYAAAYQPPIKRQQKQPAACRPPSELFDNECDDSDNYYDDDRSAQEDYCY